ncbi:MAG TPA: hypothetical protein VHB79_17315 [Polyangiaceae bacterium]|nr:hypothetical protein [Polyangiaceae bacterium]
MASGNVRPAGRAEKGWWPWCKAGGTRSYEQIPEERGTFMNLPCVPAPPAAD